MNKISVEINEIVKDLNSLAKHPIFANSTTPLNDQINVLQRQIIFGDSSYLAISVYDRNGTEIIDTSDKTPEGNASQEEYFKQALLGGTYFDKNPDEIAFNQTGFHFSTPIYDANKVIKSIMDLEVSISFIDNVVNNTLFETDTESRLLNFTSRIVHNDGSIVYTTSQENGAHNVNAPDDISVTLAGAPITQYEKGKSQDSIMIVIPESQSAKGYRSDGNWTFLLEGNLSPIMSDYNKIVNDFLISSTAIILIAILATIVAVKKITSPISYLKNSALELSKGNFDKEIMVGGSNEVKDLSISLESMRRNIENSKKNLVRKFIETARDLERTNEELKTKGNEVNSISNELWTSYRTNVEFLSALSHELKVLITPMKLYIEMIEKGNRSGNQDDSQRKTRNSIGTNISKIETLIDDIFTFYELESINLPSHMKATNIVELIEKNISELSPRMKDKRIKFSSTVNASGSTLCDPVRIGQVLSYMINNAIERAPEQSGEINIRVEQEAKCTNTISFDDSVNKYHKSIIFTIEDNGIGINPDNMERLTDRYFQIDSRLSRKIGLWFVICKGIIDSHGGKIWIHPSYHTGNSFKFSLEAL
jgi:signal transduction histidine kinase